MSEATEIQSEQVGFVEITDSVDVDTAVRRRPQTRVSRGGLDEINPYDVIYGEYSSKLEKFGEWIDLVYLDNDILRTYSGTIPTDDSVVEELKVLLRNEEMFYLVPIRELTAGFAFKRTDIATIKNTSTISGNDKHAPSCVWTMHFTDSKIRTLEANFQAYFAYGNTIRPTSMTNASLLDTVFGAKREGSGL